MSTVVGFGGVRLPRKNIKGEILLEKLRVFEAFSGVGSQKMALRNKNINHEVVAISEIDKGAIKSYGNIHKDIVAKVPEVTSGVSDEDMYTFLEERNVPLNYKTFECTARKLKGEELKQVFTSCKLTNNLGDISKIKTEDIPDHDLFTYSFPCQDISIAGNQKGCDVNSKSRSGLLWECQKVISVKRPKFLLLENVKNLVGKSHKHNFELWLAWLESQGYTNYWKVINAENVNVPQIRNRVFVVSVLGGVPFEFHDNLKLTKTVRDVLEPVEKVPEKYYKNNPYTIIDSSARIVAKFDDIKFDQSRRIHGLDNSFQTLGAGERGTNIILQDDGRTRKLMPIECWRLMGFWDIDFYKAAEVTKPNALVKQAGNSIVVPVLEIIFEELLKDYIRG